MGSDQPTPSPGRIRGFRPIGALRSLAQTHSKHIIGRGERRLRLNTALACLILTMTVVTAESAKWLLPMDRWLYDRRARYCQFFTPPPTDKIVHLDIDDGAVEDIGRWPWPRETQAALLDVIGEAGPKVVALDIIYSEPQKPHFEPVESRTHASAQPAALTVVTTQPSDALTGQPTSAGATRCVLVKDDEILAQTMRQLGNVLLPSSMSINTEPRSKLTTIARETLTGDIELSQDELIAAMRLQGFRSAEDAAQLRLNYLELRRDAVAVRISREFDAAAAKGQPLPTLEDLYQRLLRKNDPHSPVGRDIEVKYPQVLGMRELRRFDPPVPPGLPALYEPEMRDTLVPIPQLLQSASATAFVNYPRFRDGVVRSVPLVIEYDGRLVPQMGLMMACMLLDADIASLRYSRNAITIPGKGKNGSDIVIPLYTLQPESGGPTIPMTFDIPWVGTRDWEYTYPKQPHRSLNIAYAVIHTREKIAETNAQVDKAMNLILLSFDEAKAKEYADHRLPLNDPLSRMKRIEETVATVDPFLPPGTNPDDKGITPDVRLQIIASRAIHKAQDELPRLAQQLHNQQADLKQIVHGRAVLIGWAATGATDREPTSIHPDAPGPVVHGMIVNGILTGEMWRKLPDWATALVTVGLGLAVTAFATWLPPGRALLASIALLATFVFVNGIILFDWGNLLMDTAGPILAVGFVWGGGTVTRLMMESIERARITRRFGSYVDPQLVDYVLESEEDIFQGQEREMTVVFTDLKGFTSLSEKLGREIVPLLNEFMGQATGVVKKHTGLVNKFLGDGLMFFFNAPRFNTKHASDAVDCILDLRVMMLDFNRSLAERGLPTLALRAGVTTGEMIVGDAGSSDRSDYTVLGDNVNLASRLESANKATGTNNLMTERTVQLAGDHFLFRPVGRLQVVGQTVGVMVYEALAYKATATEEQKRLAALSAEVVAAFDSGRPADCLESLVKLEEQFGENLLTQMYRDRCECYLREPNAGVFEGQIVLTSK